MGWLLRSRLIAKGAPIGRILSGVVPNMIPPKMVANMGVTMMSAAANAEASGREGGSHHLGRHQS